ncbi:hypothetical protein AOZ06_04100 [Kibdelosporangium phytohabitans]|uniref:EAL domain-containing protein n=1 Tax=Kibdelosporangium phytohabitans TaxID=860235 RepID=A0A0N9HWK3_9PSEU|nr:hypothetical protein AOZ06_04100 [Kibdelosporangium phytohabitans]
MLENTPDTPDYPTLIDTINEHLAGLTIIGDTGRRSVGEHRSRTAHRPCRWPPRPVVSAHSTMRRAKAAGKRQWQALHVQHDHEHRKHDALAAAMPGAWEMGEIDWAYQPVLHLLDNRLAALEIVLRWNHPTESLISPLPRHGGQNRHVADDRPVGRDARLPGGHRSHRRCQHGDAASATDPVAVI